MSSNQASENDALPKDLMEIQLGQIDLLVAMYSSDEAISLDSTSSKLVEALRAWCEGDEETAPNIAEPGISALLNLEVPQQNGSPTTENVLQLEVLFPLVHHSDDAADGTLTDPPPPKTRVRQPAWMSKADAARLTSDIPKEDIFTIIEAVKDLAAEYLVSKKAAALESAKKNIDEAIVRVWFYFPSISTRSKRDDLINHAPGYGLTGFLLAGKPGVLCVEGGSQTIDDYMKFIKTESWGDIPSGHKKVSERYRESGSDIKRAFQDMQEITDDLGERRGERANRNDMKALEAWLNEKGVGEAFSKVLI
uniref:Small nuclear ribonucleoprotein Prp3 C-terminal domain-containing protein n=1 Tax=Bionectria ochroleuca TaxID=29856 RepID=A0A8H7NMC2_BIOOC